MRGQLAPQVQAILGQSALVIITERGDEVAVLIGQRVTMGFGEVLDRPLPRPWKQRGRSWGWTAVRWLASLLTEGDHRKGAGDADITGRQTTLSHLSAQVIAPLDFRDDRRGPLRQSLRQPQSWQRIAAALQAPSMAVSAFPHDVIRCEATPVAGDHDVREGGLWPCGPRTDEPSRPQSKGMTGALDPGGRP